MISIHSFLDETRNILFTFSNGVTVSIGVSSFHYCDPRNNQGHDPEREAVELAVILPNEEWGTREVIENVLGFDPNDDVCPCLDADQVAKVIAYVQQMKQEDE